MVAALIPSMALGSAAPVLQPPRFASKSSVESRYPPPPAALPPLTRRIFNTIQLLLSSPVPKPKLPKPSPNPVIPSQISSKGTGADTKILDHLRHIQGA